tara:strand:+ start:179 stop:538 length:360 start_codon:yes stop_codon:yes gene_type:complete
MANLPNTAAGTAFVPIYNSRKTNAPNTRVVKFGDGYEHRTSFGLNQNAKIFNLTFVESEADADTLTDFFDARAVDGANFTYTVPTESAMNFVVEGGYTKTNTYLGRATVQVSFRQVFEP